MTTVVVEQQILLTIARAQREHMRELVQQADEAGMPDVAKYRRGLVKEFDHGIRLLEGILLCSGDLYQDQHSVPPQHQPQRHPHSAEAMLRPVPPAPKPEPIQKGGIPFPGSGT